MSGVGRAPTCYMQAQQLMVSAGRVGAARVVWTEAVRSTRAFCACSPGLDSQFCRAPGTTAPRRFPAFDPKPCVQVGTYAGMYRPAGPSMRAPASPVTSSPAGWLRRTHARPVVRARRTTPTTLSWK